ncbi:MAG: CBS domain-containing protein [Lentimicrobiaceae bacterium]|nr:CBS domain-containing protein [Lentimicrobiaceae bacterium]
MTNTQQFIELYKKLELAASIVYNGGMEYKQGESFVHSLKLDRRFDSTKIDYCREFRNILQHKLNDFGVEPTDAMIRFLEETINKLENPKKISDIWIRKEKIRTASLDDKVLPIMNEMREKIYTHIPILENELLIGVFSENTLFQYLSDNEIISIEEEMQMSEFGEYLSFDKYINESFLFVKRDTTVYEVKQIFESYFAHKKRIGMIFSTHNGKVNERLLGIITPWDILGADV